MLKLRSDLNLTAEPSPIHFRGELRREKLYDDPAAKQPVTRNKDAAHSAAAELSLDFVCVGEGVF
jgi:hypothetical protein